MAEPVKIAIVIEGGIVQAVLSAGVPVEYAVIDYDTDGAEGVVPVPQDGGETADALPVQIRDAETDESARRFTLWAFANE